MRYLKELYYELNHILAYKYTMQIKILLESTAYQRKEWRNVGMSFKPLVHEIKYYFDYSPRKILDVCINNVIFIQK